MPKIIATLLLLLVEPILSKIIGAIGFGLVSYAGVRLLFDQLENAISSRAGSLTSDIYGFLALIGFGESLSIVTSALLVRAYLTGMNSAGNIVRSTYNKG